MEVLHPDCAGLDVHKNSVVACVRHIVNGKAATRVKTFKTTTQELMALSEWLSAECVTHIVLEATGVFWKPIWHILSDGEFELVLANAAHVKNVPGRKTDVNDATWLADLMAHGLIRASFVPDEPTQQIRDLLRTRKQFVRERSAHTQRIQKTLEDANIKLDSVVTDILGLSGRRMIEALIGGQTEPGAIAKLAHRRLQASGAELEAALRGRVTDHHRFLLRLHLDQVDALDTAIARIDQEVDGNVEPFRAAIEMLSTIPGVSSLSASVIVSEIGIEMNRFPTEGHLISWSGLCPKNNESAGKRRSTRMKKGAPWLKTTLVQCAWAATRTKQSYLQAQYLRIRSRRGANKAIVPSPPPCSPPSTTCSKTGPSTMTSGRTTSTTELRESKFCDSSIACKTSDSPSRSRPARHSRDMFLLSTEEPRGTIGASGAHNSAKNSAKST